MSIGPALVEVAFTVSAEQAEMAEFHVGEFSPGGFQYEWDEASGGARFRIFVPAGDEGRIGTFLVRAGIDTCDQQVTPVAADWSERWKEFHQPVVVGGLWVGPPWQLNAAPSGVKPVVIEPGQGFGTGAHPTTRLMLALLDEQPRASLLDIGCGSGVLTVAASLLGFAPIAAVDNDPAAIVSTTENLARNNVRGVSVRRMDVLHETVPPADVVLANLTLEPLVALAPRIHSPRAVLSGLLASQAPTCVAVWEEHGYVLRERRDRDGWVALVLDNADPIEQTMYNRSII